MVKLIFLKCIKTDEAFFCKFFPMYKYVNRILSKKRRLAKGIKIFLKKKNQKASIHS